MNWPQIFLGCFVIGFVFSVMSFALSALGLHVHPHLPFMHHPHVPHAPQASSSSGVSPLNMATTMAFLAWFGGTGYLLTSRFGWVAFPALGVAAVSGLIGAALVFWVMAHVLWSPHENMQVADSAHRRRARPGESADPAGWYRRGHLLEWRRQAIVRRTQRRRSAHRERRGSGRDGVRARHRVGTPVGRPGGRGKRGPLSATLPATARRGACPWNRQRARPAARPKDAERASTRPERAVEAARERACTEGPAGPNPTKHAASELRERATRPDARRRQRRASERARGVRRAEAHGRRQRASCASEPRDRSAPAKRRARERVGGSGGAKPPGN